MLQGVVIALSIVSAFALQAAARGASVYTAKPEDPSLLVLSKEKFPGLHADGVTDDSDTLQQAIDQARAGGLVLLVPEGRYLISKTIGIPPATRLLGFGKTRPVIVLGPHTPGFDANAPKYMIWFSGGGRGGRGGPNPAIVGGNFSDANPGTFYSGISNIDFEIQDGNPAAVAIRATSPSMASLAM